MTAAAPGSHREAPIPTRLTPAASTAVGPADAALGLAREAERQRHLLAMLAQPAAWPPPPLGGGPTLAPLDWARPAAQGAVGRGVAAYRANRLAHAALALAALVPTVADLVGPDALAALAGAYGERHPPEHGDGARFAEALPAFIAASEQLATEPYLADVARLDLAVAQAARAADAERDTASLALLAECDPDVLCLGLAPGVALLPSAHPVVAIWQAHHGGADGDGAGEEDVDRARPGEADRFFAVRAAMAAGRGECALVWRQGWVVRVVALAPADAAFTAAVVAGESLGLALAAAGAGFDFAAWLAQALRCGLLLSAASRTVCAVT